MVKIQENEEPKEKKVVKEKTEKKGKKKQTVKYLVIVGLVLAFVLGILASYYITNQSKEKLGVEHKSEVNKLQSEISKLTSEKESALALVSSEKSTLVAEKEKLELENNNLEKESNLLDGILAEISKENKEIESVTNYNYKITWQKYILAKPGVKFTSEVKLENIGSVRRTFNLDIRLRSNYKDAITTTPTDGSLTLADGSSGNINLEFKPEQEGYAIFGLYVNGHHAGDIVVFVREQ